MGEEYTTTISCQTYLKALSDDPINPEDISVEIEANNSAPELNTAVLAILWAHFQACRQGLLKESEQTPWSQIEKESRWTLFLKEVIKDTSWVEWIEDPIEIREKAKQGYSQIKNK
ncbi:hypothetical protein Halha_1267 [Halobacteroides halobius DSM 5150]|uniref:Uncharacterized protein n=1 Tax=Halobacteroides halobius (strain ATCC 35273 / DSM 5150 / MD-1) TaxID=748449 RepID=L0KAU6_HALHC|nr:hypothetical protein [Halobacteroides halobius]AGB41213.1 hypothetical protein Halha_1267 [Halobacteroides halobius DSM 5150]